MLKTYVSLDLEMTSARPENQEVIEIAALKFQGDRTIESWSTLVRPRGAIPYNVQVLTGLSKSDLARAPILNDVSDQLKRFVGELPLVAHSVSLDVGCLRRQGVSLSNPQVDTFELASILLPQMPSYSLASLAQHFGIDFPTQHRAMHDALVTKQLFLKLVEQAEGLDLSIVQEINRLVFQHAWPLKEFFVDIEGQLSRTAMGTSIRQRLAASQGVAETDITLLLAPERPDEPLRPQTQIAPVDPAKITTMLGPKGLFAEHLPGYEHRAPQVKMARAVTDAFNKGEQIIIEAGTGTGKSAAYLLPAIHFAVANRQRVVVSTNTINLQDQLIGKDLPDLRSLLPFDFKTCVVKGRSNYLCLQRLASFRRRSDLSPSETIALIKILVWLPGTLTGDLGELNLTDAERPVWHRLSASHEVCTPATCQYARRGTCFLYRARSRAEASHVIVVNHALLLSDIATASKVLPEYEHLIVDEAHHLEQQATDQLGYSLQSRDVESFLNDLLRETVPERRTGILAEVHAHFAGSSCPPEMQLRVIEQAHNAEQVVAEVRESNVAFFQNLCVFMSTRTGESRGYELRLRITSAVRTQPAWSEIDGRWEEVSIRLMRLQEELTKFYNLVSGLEQYDLLEFEEYVGQILGELGVNERIRTEGNAIVATPNAEQVYWATLGSSGEASLHSAPLEVATLLNQDLFGQKRTVVLTSATLTTDGTFSYVKSRLGLTDARDLAVGSPFDYRESTLLFIPKDMPEPDQPYFQKSLQQTLLSLCTATEGRTLVLFTSHAQLRATWQGIHQPLADRGILVLGHGVDTAPRRQLLQTFKTNPKTVLLGASSFWEGIDVVGDALSVLAITRLPFNVPTDPVFAARSELFEDPFHDYGLPQMILRFKQGFGRLIRSRSDRGIVVMLDRRVTTKGYGQSVLQSLPTCTTHVGTLAELPDVAKEWLTR